jgi:outer membrane lipoprotein-sorting protein
MRILITGKGADVIPALEKLNIPMFYFDKFGTPTEKPKMKKPAPAGVTVKTVMDSYINAIGGAKAVAGVKTLFVSGSSEIEGAPAPLAYTSKKDAKGKSLFKLELVGMMELSKQVIGDKSGYTAAQGQKKDLTPEEFAEKKATVSTFEELLLANKADVTLDGIEPVNGSDAYAIKNGKTTLYYDVKTGLKLMTSTTAERNGQKMTSTITYSDYKDVKGIKVPFNIVMSQGRDIDVKITDVKINEGVSDADFQ